jgi:hypothetical protein
MTWSDYTVITTEQTVRAYFVRAQSPTHARERFGKGANDKIISINPGDEEVVEVRREMET